MLVETALSHFCLKPYAPREEFDYIGLARENFRHATSLVHVPHLEDYWANFPDEFKVRKRLWSRLTVSQINMFKVDLNTCKITKDEVEDVIDPFYVDQIECIPIPELDQTRREEDSLLSRTLEVLKRTKKGLKSKNVESTTPRVLGKYSRDKQKKTQPKPKAITNLNIANPIVGSLEAEAKVEEIP